MFSLCTVFFLVIIGFLIYFKLKKNIFLLIFILSLIIYYFYFVLEYLVYISTLLTINSSIFNGLYIAFTVFIFSIFILTRNKNFLLLKNKILLSCLTILSIITALYIRTIGAVNIENYTINLYSNNPETFLLKDYGGDHFGIYFLFIFIIGINLIYFFLYFIKIIILNKDIKRKTKIYFYIRDIGISLTVFVGILLTFDLKELYNTYYQRYKNPVYFADESYTCIDDTKLILHREYKHHPIVNNYDNFFQFYNNYGKKITYGDKILSNNLNKELVTKKYLSKCRGLYNINYYEAYNNIHGDLPENNIINPYNYWGDEDEYKYNRMYSHTKEEVELILSKMKYIK